jgi:hypothetical protein
LALETRTVEVPVDDGRPIRVECAISTLTRLIFPEQLLTLRWSKGAREALGAHLRSTAPVGIVEVQPTKPATTGSIEARGPSQTLKVEITVVPKGAPIEVRLVITRAKMQESGQPVATDRAPAPPTPKGAAGAGEPLRNGGPLAGGSEPSVEEPLAGMRNAKPEEEAREAPGPTALSPPAPPNLNLAGLVTAEVLPIGRREIQPGRREVVLVDLLRSQDWLWLRFTVCRGAGQHVDDLRWEHGRVDTYLTEAVGEDLRIVVQVPRALATPKSMVTLRIGGGEYQFRLRPGTLTAFVRQLFQ